jgi:hypothetical protein
MGFTFMRKVSLIILALGLGAATAAHAANPVRISQVYGGGAGGAYRCDYVELFNDSEAPVDIGGWSIQYGSAGGSSFASATYNWAKIPSGATVPACGYYLVRGYCGTDGAELPVTPDLVPASGWSFNLSGVAGKVALFRDQVTGRTCASAQASSQLVDLVGYGGANCYETAPAPELDVASVLARASGGAVDSDDNSTDFARVPASAVTVHNSAGAPNPECRLGSAPPDVPVLAAPLDGATGTVAPVTLEVTVSDPEADELSVSFHGRPVVPWPQGEEFSLVLLPDTENYTAYSNGGKNAMFVAQTQWVVGNLAARNLAARNIAARNIAAVAHLGDITSSDSRTQYVRADSAMRLLEDPETTGLADGVPYVMIRGNSDGSSNFNDYWGVSRFAGRGYYGGHYGSGNDHSYILFSAAGRDFILVALSFDPSSAALEWAHGVLAAHPGRLGIVVSHSVLNPGNPASWTSEGYPIYSALRDLPNLLLLLCGHMNGEGRRRDVHAGVVVHSLLTDYQLYPGGGNGWLRILEFVPAANKVRARTYSPWLDQWSAGPDSSSQFTLDVPLGGVSQPDYALLGTVTGVPSGANAVLPWSGLAPGTQHEWYVEVGDGRTRRTGPPWSFTTGASSSTGAGEEPRGGLALAPPAPNPARGSLRFAFDLPRAMHARLSVLDVQGRVVAVLAEGGFAAGQHERAWDATAAARADAGLYFVRLETPEGTRVRRVAVVR